MTTNTASLHPEASPLPEVPWERVERFVGQLTHDVRNGLNALELQLTFLGEISSDQEIVKEVRLIRRTVTEVTRQLQAVRVATGTVSLNRLSYPAKDFFEDLQERFERNDPGAEARVKWGIEVGSILLSIDPELSMAALLELIANALRFAAPADAIFFKASAVGDSVVVSLSERLLEPPTLNPETWGRTPLLSTSRSAYGLGLFRARRIVEAQGGTLEALYLHSDKVLTINTTFPTSCVP